MVSAKDDIRGLSGPVGCLQRELEDPGLCLGDARKQVASVQLDGGAVAEQRDGAISIFSVFGENSGRVDH